MLTVMGKPPDHLAICWSCQKTLPFGAGTDGARVRLEANWYLPVCRDCWERMPESERLRLAVMFRDRGPEVGKVASVLDWMSEVMAHTDLGQQVPPWIRRGGEDIQN